MATHAELITATTDSAKELVEHGVLKFRQGEDQTEMIHPSQLASLLLALSNDNVIAAINGAAASDESRTDDFFNPIC